MSAAVSSIVCNTVVGVLAPPDSHEEPVKPRQAATTARRTRLTVSWYGAGTRRIEAATGCGHWYKGGEELVLVRWVFVRDAAGTHRDEYLLTTDTALTADAVVGIYCGRWSIEKDQANRTSS